MAPIPTTDHPRRGREEFPNAGNTTKDSKEIPAAEKNDKEDERMENNEEATTLEFEFLYDGKGRREEEKDPNTIRK